LDVFLAAAIDDFVSVDELPHFRQLVEARLVGREHQ
jgi:hypothetical protein